MITVYRLTKYFIFSGTKMAGADKFIHHFELQYCNFCWLCLSASVFDLKSVI